MKDQDIIKAVVELDGRTFPYGIQVYQHQKEHSQELEWWSCDQHGSMAQREFYLTSRDEIVQVIKKQIISFELASQLEVALELILERDCCFNKDEDWKLQLWLFTMPAKQLCEALLRATGKWKD